MRSTTTRDQHAAHAALVNEILLYLGNRDDVLISRRVVGTFRRVKGDPSIYRIGTPGEPDLQGVWLRIIRPYWVWMKPRVWMNRICSGHTLIGQAFTIEVKTGGGRLSKEQRDWRDRFESLGGIYVLARSLNDVKKMWPPR